MAVEKPLARDDLIIAPRVIAGETAYFVCDPIKNEYKQLDEMQYEVFKRLDGKRTIVGLVDELKKTFDLDVSAEDLGQFIDNLQDMNLLDLAADTRVDTKHGKEIAAKVKAKIAREGVVFARRTGSPLPRDRRERTDEATLFDKALDHLDAGRIRPAAAALRAVLARAPRNYRARYLLHALLSEHIGGRTNVDNFWWWRIPIVNPDEVLGRIDRAIGRLVFSKAFLVAWCLLVGSCVFLVAGDFDRLVDNVQSFMTLDWVFDEPIFPIVFWTVGPLSMLGHEMAHGLACKHFGGRVREMGILIAYLNPTAYCDISSTYLIQDRWQRALVSLAGPMFSYIVWSVWVLLWVLSNPDTLVGRLATVYVPIIGYSYVLQVVNPLMKNDGYYALTDVINAPNLRDDAFQYLKLRALRVLLGTDIEIPEDLEARKRMLLLYAVPGVIGTVLTNTVVLAIIAGYLIRRFHSIGVLFVAFMLWGAIGSPLRKLIVITWQSRATLWASRRFRRVFAVAVALLLAALVAPWPLTIEADAHVQPQIEAVRTRLPLVVDQVLVAEGERVSAGQALVRMSEAAAKTEVTAAQAAREQAELDLTTLKEQRRDEELGVARAAVSGDAGVVERDNQQIARVRALVKKGLVPQDKLDALEAHRAQALTKVLAAQGDLHLKSATGTALEIDAATAVVDGLAAEERAARKNLADATLVSPVDGFVMLPSVAHEMRGAFFKAGAEVLRVRALTAPKLALAVPITEPISGLVVGAKARARLVGLPDESLGGTVTSVSPAATSDSTLRAEVTLDEAVIDNALPSGLSGTVLVSAGWHPVAWHLYARALRLVQIDLARLFS